MNILIDTGSPISFHPSGVLNFGQKNFCVHSSVPGVSTQYLCEKVGCDINGLLGMDVINRQPMLFSLKNGFLLWDDDAKYINRFNMYPLGALAGGLIAITISVNGMTANMIVDSGAPISYIHPNFVAGLECAGIMDDFSPFIGNFQTRTFICEVDTLTGQGVYSQRFGAPPQIISLTLAQLNADGVIGIELFKRFRIQFNNRIVFLPPQGI
jgi:hypothetical protein